MRSARASSGGECKANLTPDRGGGKGRMSVRASPGGGSVVVPVVEHSEPEFLLGGQSTG